jgi:predicted RNase H-like nuclease
MINAGQQSLLRFLCKDRRGSVWPAPNKEYAMRVKIDEDEWYPVLTIDTDLYNYGREVEVTQELFDEYTAAIAAFHVVQKKLKAVKALPEGEQ